MEAGANPKNIGIAQVDTMLALGAIWANVGSSSLMIIGVACWCLASVPKCARGGLARQSANERDVIVALQHVVKIVAPELRKTKHALPQLIA